MSAHEKREQRANIWEQMKAVLEGAEKKEEGLSAEERAKYDALEKDLDRLGGEIVFEEKHEERAKEMAKPNPERVGPAPEATEEERNDKGGEYRKIFKKYLVAGPAGMNQEERTVLQSGFVEARALASGVTTAGGFSVPQGFRDTITETLKFFGGVRSVAETITTDAGNDLPWPTNDDTANKGAILAENTAVTEQDVVLGQKILKAYMYSSKLIRVSYQLLQDSAFDLENWLGRKLGERIARIQNEHFTTGTGTAQPEGVQTNSVIGVTGAVGTTTSVTYGSLVDLVYSVDAAYRASGRSRFMMNDATIGKLRGLVDGQSRPLWEPGVQANTPDLFLGYGIVANNDMPVMAANAKSILFGDFFAGYVIRDVSDFALLRLEERYADFLQVGFLGFQRADALPQDLGAYKSYRNSAT